MRGPDTRTIAKSWIEHNVKAGSTILEEGCLFGVAISGPQLASTAISVKRDFDKAVATSGSGSLQKIRQAHLDKIYGDSPLYDIIKVDKLGEADIRTADSSLIIVTANNDKPIGDELGYFVEEGYYEKRKAMKITLAKKYALEKSFAPTVEFTAFFPHLMEQDYRALRALNLAKLKDVIRGPQIDIYKRRP